MITKTAKALKEYDRLVEQDASDEMIEEARKAVAIAFSKESPNSEDLCREVIYPGPAVPGPGKELSFVRQMVEMSKTSDMKWNPRFVHYARVHGEKDPAKIMEKDREQGVAMMNFHFWIEKKWNEWYKSIGVGHLSLENQRYYQNQAAFDKWLAKEKS